MAKVTFSSLGLKLNQEIKTILVKGKNIEVKQYLPIQDKLEIVSNVSNSSQDGNNFKNMVKVEMFTDLEIINHYTNLTFTEKQKEEPWKIYDVLKQAGIIKQVKEAIPEEELESLEMYINDATERIYTYRNSAYGILDAIGSDYSNLELDADNLKNEILNDENVGLIKDILTKLG